MENGEWSGAAAAGASVSRIRLLFDDAELMKYSATSCRRRRRRRRCHRFCRTRK